MEKSTERTFLAVTKSSHFNIDLLPTPSFAEKVSFVFPIFQPIFQFMVAFCKRALTAGTESMFWTINMMYVSSSGLIGLVYFCPPKFCTVSKYNSRLQKYFHAVLFVERGRRERKNSCINKQTLILNKKV